MTDKVVAAIDRYSMLAGSRRVCVALSGGADSVALLLCLQQLSSQLNIELSAVHINHCLRGEESERDEQFVRQLCARLQVPLFVHTFSVAELAADSGESIELAARRVRYGVFDALVADRYTVATAHTADDNLETVLMNITRGTGLRGVGGIPPVRDGIIRPLYYCSRADIEHYLAELGEPFVTDSTNADTDITRNRVRHLVVPELKSINPAAQLAALRMSEQCREVADMIERMADSLLSEAANGDGFLTANLACSERPVLSAALKAAAEKRLGSECDSFHTEQLIKLILSGGRLQLTGGFAEVSCGKLRFVSEPYTRPKAQPPSLLKPGDNQLGCYTVKVESTQIVHELSTPTAICRDKIIGKPMLRTRMAGDSIALVGRPRKSLKKLMNEAAVPISQRDCLPLIADEGGVIWIAGFGCDRRVAASSGNCLVVSVEEDKNA